MHPVIYFNSETFRDRLLKARARDTAGSQGGCTRQDRPQPQLATPQQATQIVQKKSVNPTVDDSRQPGKIVRSVSIVLYVSIVWGVLCVSCVLCVPCVLYTIYCILCVLCNGITYIFLCKLLSSIV